MAHEELKALYEIDKQYSVTPYQYWEFKHISVSGDWVNCFFEPAFHAGTEYRRKPGAPVWPVSDDTEDARKWRELEAFYQGNGIMDTAKKFLEIIEPKQEFIQGYTAEEWQAIIDGEFLCEFDTVSDLDQTDLSIGFLRYMGDKIHHKERFNNGSEYFKYCRPLRIKGVRQPWFGGECPVTGDVVIKMRDGQVRLTSALMSTWQHGGRSNDIVEFIEL